MIFYSKSIKVNCQCLVIYYDIFYTYICIQVPYGAIYHKFSKAFHLLVNSGGWFFIVKGFSSGRHIYAGNKTPFTPIERDKNSIPENFPQCEQCPKPDNSRPSKAIFCFIGKSLVRNSSLSFGRLVYCMGKCWYVVALWFYREVGAVFK